MSLDVNAIQYAWPFAGVIISAAAQVLQLMLDEDCTVPFIARYRKEMTGGLDEVQIAKIREGYDEYLEREKERVCFKDD